MNIKEKIEQNLKNLVKEKFDIDLEASLEKPKDKTHGDYASNIAMRLTKQLGKNPMEIAEDIVNELRVTRYEFIDSTEAVKPGFINFRIHNDYYKPIVDEVLYKKESFGKSDIKKGKTILIEHTSPNPNKEFHLGHLKNNVTGIAVSNLFEGIGAKVFRDCIDNNRGIAIAKLMWGYLKFAKKDESLPTDLNYWYEHRDQWKTPESEGIAPGKFVDSLYTKGSIDVSENEESEKAVRQMVVDWEAEDKKNWALWELTQMWVWEGYKQSMGRVGGWKFDQIWHEHEIYKYGKEHVERGLKMGIFKKLEDGAILSDLKKEFNLADTILIKNDGTSLYITQDLELTKRKREKFHPDEMFWVIGPEQSLAMSQMFAICSQLGFGKFEDYHHLPYGFILVKNKEGNAEKMSSRKGTQFHVNDLVDKAKEEIKKYIKEGSLSDKEIDEVSEKVAIGAIKYSLLKVSRITDQVFDFETTISFDGDSGPYLMYTYARARSILRQANMENSKLDLKNIYTSKYEINLIKQIYNFTNIIVVAASIYEPHLIANYLYELATKFNQFYKELSVLNAETKEDKIARLKLVEATSIVLKNGLNLLGIETVEKM